MERYILTGTPGCGKTSIIRTLEMQGHCVIEEAATDVIAYEQSMGVPQPWEKPVFIDQIVGLQKQRQIQLESSKSALQFYDRSPICAAALASYLGFEPSTSLTDEIKRIKEQGIYKTRVLFIENLGFCQPTDARKISFEESLHFEQIHKETYNMFGYECVMIPKGSLADRAADVLRHVLQR
jgi:predicted ATPase